MDRVQAGGKKDQEVLGLCVYWSGNKSRAHTLGLSLGKSVLICDVESLKRLPRKLKDLLRESKIHGVKASIQLEKLRFLEVCFGRFF